MPQLQSKLDSLSPSFLANAAHLRSLVADLTDNTAKAAEGGGVGANAKHVARGKLLPRERVAVLLDPGSPFLELSPLAAWNLYGKDGQDAPGAGVIAGIDRPVARMRILKMILGMRSIQIYVLHKMGIRIPENFPHIHSA